MSGIYGYIVRDDKMVNNLPYMAKWHSNYGKDASGEVCIDNVGMGCFINHIPTRTVIGDAVNHVDNYYAVIDALIYNRDEIQMKMPDIDVSLFSDERLLLEVYIRFGFNGLREVNGDFAGAVYDGEKLNLFRDHLGIRTLYWYQDDNMIAFATDMRGILAIPGIDKSLDEEYLYANLTGWLVDESEVTDFAKIRAVKTGSYITVSKSFEIQKALYWKLGEKKIRFKTEQEYIAKLRELVYDSIRRRLAVVEGQPVGAELSGGMDSTVIDVIIKELGVDPVCYSWSPSIDENPLQHHDERVIIEDTCKKFGLTCKYGFSDVSADDKKNWEDMNSRILPPGVYNSFVNSTMSYMGSQNIKVVFSGWGGDEGVSHRCNPYELWYAKEYLQYFKVHWDRSHGLKKPLRFMKRVYRNLKLDGDFFNSPWNFYDVNRIKKPDILTDGFVDKFKTHNWRLEYFAFDPIKDISCGANRGRIETSIITGAQYGVQCVFPYLDYRVEDFAVSIPRTLHIRGNQYRWIYRRAFKNQMPASLLNYEYKDDPGRCSLMCNDFWGDEEQSKRLELIVPMLDEKIWCKYLDYNKMNKIIESSDDSSVGFVVDILTRCFSVQVCLTK